VQKKSAFYYYSIILEQKKGLWKNHKPLLLRQARADNGTFTGVVKTKPASAPNVKRGDLVVFEKRDIFEVMMRSPWSWAGKTFWMATISRREL